MEDQQRLRQQRFELIETAIREWWEGQEFPKVALKATTQPVGGRAVSGSPALLKSSTDTLVKRAA